MSFVSVHLRRRRVALGVSYVGVVAENAFELLYPFAIGLAVDGLLDDSYAGLVVFATISLTHTALGVLRQWHDARVFNRLYTELASELVESQRAAGVGTTAVAARAALTGEYVEFLQRDVDATVTAAFALIGSLVMLFLYDPLLGLAALATAGPVALLNRRLVGRSRQIFRNLNDESELEVSLIEHATTTEVRRHFGVIAGHWTRLSDAEAASWGIVDVLALGLAVVALVRTTRTDVEVGTIFAVLAYVWAYLGGFDQVPGVLQRMANLSDIRRRLDGLGDTARA